MEPPNRESAIRLALVPLIRSAGIRKTAARTGMHHSTLMRWMAGRARITDAHVEALASYLGVTLRFERCQEPPDQPT